MQPIRSGGLTAFVGAWLGHFISTTGSVMTQFALIYWAYQNTGQATSLALMSLCTIGPGVLLSPLAGALVDRLDRKRILMLTDVAGAITSLVILLLYRAAHLQLWHLYALGAFSSIFQTFQFPTYSAIISTMIPKTQYGRAIGMMQFALSGSSILGPMLGSLLLTLIGLSGIFTIDIITFVIALVSLSLVHIAPPTTTQDSSHGVWQEATYGVRYILSRPSLLALQTALLACNLINSIIIVIQPAMILARTGNDAQILASVTSMSAVGGAVGGLLISVWGGPKDRAKGMLVCLFLTNVVYAAVLGPGRSLLVWASGAFATSVLLNILNGASQALWQAKVAPAIQGRVFAARRMIAQILAPVGMLISGPMADRVFEPAMRRGGVLMPLFSGLVGTGAGAGIGLMFVLAGTLGAALVLIFSSLRVVRNAESLLPDHDQ